MPGPAGTRVYAVHAETSLPCEASSVREARRFVTATLSAWGHDETGFSAALLVSELATNAFLHARTPLRVVVDGLAEGARVTVVDGSDLPVRPRRHSAESGTGRGLLLVEQVAAAWGVDPSSDGKAVWFLVPWQQQDTGEEPDLDSFLALDETVGCGSR